jgi:hypothetical protein
MPEPNRWTLANVADVTKAKVVETLVNNARLPGLTQVGTIVPDGNLDVEEAALAQEVEGLFAINCGDHVRVYAVEADKKAA